MNNGGYLNPTSEVMRLGYAYIFSSSMMSGLGFARLKLLTFTIIQKRIKLFRNSTMVKVTEILYKLFTFHSTENSNEPNDSIGDL